MGKAVKVEKDNQTTDYWTGVVGLVRLGYCTGVLALISEFSLDGGQIQQFANAFR